MRPGLVGWGLLGGLASLLFWRWRANTATYTLINLSEPLRPPIQTPPLGGTTTIQPASTFTITGTPVQVGPTVAKSEDAYWDGKAWNVTVNSPQGSSTYWNAEVFLPQDLSSFRSTDAVRAAQAGVGKSGVELAAVDAKQTLLRRHFVGLA